MRVSKWWQKVHFWVNCTTERFNPVCVQHANTRACFNCHLCDIQTRASALCHCLQTILIQCNQTDSSSSCSDCLLVVFSSQKCPFLHVFSLLLPRMPLSSIYSSVSPFDPLNVPSAGKPSEIKTSWTSTCGTTGGTAAVTCAISAGRAFWRALLLRITCSCTPTSAHTPACSAPSPTTD